MLQNNRFTAFNVSESLRENQQGGGGGGGWCGWGGRGGLNSPSLTLTMLNQRGCTAQKNEVFH